MMLNDKTVVITGGTGSFGNAVLHRLLSMEVREIRKMAKAEDVGPYYRIPADNRDLNYDQYFVEGQMLISQIEAYTSHNTERLDIEQVKTLLMTLEYIQGELRA